MSEKDWIKIGRVCTCFNLRKAARIVTQLYDKALKPSGLRSTQFALLVATKILAPVTVTRLAEVVVIDRTTLTRNLDVLEQNGLIETIPGEDKRMREVALTKAGRNKLDEAIPLWEKAQSQIVAALGEEQSAALIENLTEVIKRTKKM